MYHFRNLVFEGGGVKGIAYVGAMQALNTKAILPNIERVGGTSAGAIYATILALNYSGDETQQLLWNLNFHNFLDDSWGIIKDSKRLLKDFGWYIGDYFRKWIGERIRAKTGDSESTFADLEAQKEKKGFRSLYLIGTNLSTGFSEVFSAEHTPDIRVADAVRISMSFPLFFAAKRNPRGDVYVDGGVLDNYPIKLFDRKKYVASASHRLLPDYYARINKEMGQSERSTSSYVFNTETLGFRLSSKDKISLFRDHTAAVAHPIQDFFDYAKSLIETFIDAQTNTHLHSDDWQRTIYIDTMGVGTLEFSLLDDRKKELFASGQQGVEDYFSWFDDPQSNPVNRP